MKRHRVALTTALSDPRLCSATYLAVTGKPCRPQVQQCLATMPAQFDALRDEVLPHSGPIGHHRRVTIRAPKHREICAADIRYRVLHHARMGECASALDRALMPKVFACRVGNGGHAAVNDVPSQRQHHPVAVQVAIDGYFHAIDHGILMGLLWRRLQGRECLKVCARILASFQRAPGKGVPIGTLCSQLWANEYLNGVDRFAMDTLKVPAYCRYMDDMLWFCASRAQAHRPLEHAKAYLSEVLQLTVKPSHRIVRSERGLLYCGYEIRQGVVHPSRRKRHSYRAKLTEAYAQFHRGQLSERAFQQACQSAHSILAHTKRRQWRSAVLQRLGSR